MNGILFTSDVTKERIRRYLEKGKRFDERKFDEFRDIEIETGISKNAEGSVRVKIGKTEVIVGVKMDTVEPYSDSPNKGNLMVTAELLPLSSYRFENGPPKFPAIELARVTDRIIRESKFIEFEKLCIKEGEKVWNIFIDIYPINDDGNLFDAAGIGSVIALKNSKIPKYDKKEGKVLYGELSDENIPLSEEIPLSLTIHKVGENLFVDPTTEEEDVSETRLTIGGYDKSISSMQKGKEGTLKPEEFEKAIELFQKVQENILKKIEKFVK